MAGLPGDRKRRRQHELQRLEVCRFEARELLTGSWTPLVHLPSPLLSNGGGSQQLIPLSDGTAMALGTINPGSNGASKAWFRLTADSTRLYGLRRLSSGQPSHAGVLAQRRKYDRMQPLQESRRDGERYCAQGLLRASDLKSRS